MPVNMPSVRTVVNIATAYIPNPTAMPSPVTIQRPAAVVAPCTASPRNMMSPPAKNPTPMMMAAATRKGSKVRKTMAVGSMKSVGLSIRTVYQMEHSKSQIECTSILYLKFDILYPTKPLRLFQHLRNTGGLHAKFLQDMRCGNVLAEDDLAFEKTVLFTFGERGKAGERVYPRLLDHVHQVPSAGIVPSDQSEIRTLCIPDGVPGEACVGHQPPFVDMGRCVVRFAQIVVPRLDV